MSPVEGDVRTNPDTGEPEVYLHGAWGPLIEYEPSVEEEPPTSDIPEWLSTREARDFPGHRNDFQP